MGRELGRISGPLLAENLLRNGNNLAFETNLLYLDVVNGWIGIKNATPTRTLNIIGKTDSPYLIADTSGVFANLEFTTSQIQNVSGSITLSPNQSLNPTVNVPRLTTASLDITTNSISNTTLNSNITLDPLGTGRLVFTTTNVDVRGNLHATGNITWDGTVNIGNNDLDSISFNADTNSDILPDVTNTYSLGTSQKEWQNLYSNSVTGYIANGASITANGINLTLSQGNIIYVSVNGNDSNIGTHQHATYLTLKYALSQATSGTTVYIYPGTYTEIFPLTVPVGVSVYGADIRTVVVKPTVGTNTNNAFLLNGETTVSNLTVKDFYAPGSAFCFANNFTVTSRSPYVQNVSVITKESVVATYTENYSLVAGDWTNGFFYAQPSANIISLNTNLAQLSFYSALELTPSGTVFNVVYNDNTTDILTQTSSSSYFGAQLNIPVAGFSTSSTKSIKSISWGQINTPQNDAGNGILVDGRLANSSSKEAAMLFHAVTLIVPDAIGIQATNGARVEWLNSFTYFANKGIYLTEGTLGFASQGVKFGAEMRSIGSANVYGTYGAYADGAHTLGYLIGHNFSYVGSGPTYTGNDPTTAIPANEVVKINSGKIYYDSVDQTGNYRVGDIFQVNQETGQIAFNANNLLGGSDGSITISSNAGTTYVDNQVIQTGNISIHDNNVDSLQYEVNWKAANGTTNLSTDVNVTGNLGITGDVNIKGSLISFGDALTDNVVINDYLAQHILPKTTDTYTLGTSSNTWNTLFATTLDVDGITRLTNNTISTLTGNNNLRFVASGTGKIVVATTDVDITNNLVVATNLTASGTSSFKNTTANAVLQSGSYNITGDASLGAITGSGNITAANPFTLPTVTINGSVITGTASGSNLIFTPYAGQKVQITGPAKFNNDVTIATTLGVTGTTTFSNDVNVNAVNQVGTYNLTGNATLGNITSSGAITAANPLTLPTVTINGSVITGTAAASDLILTPYAGQKVQITGPAKFNNNVSIATTLGVTGTTTFSNDVNVNAVNQVGTYNLTGNATLGNITSAGSITSTAPLVLPSLILSGTPGTPPTAASAIVGINTNTDLVLTPYAGQKVQITGLAKFNNNVTIGTTLSVTSTTTFSNDVNTGTITQTGDFNQTGLSSASVTGAFQSRNISGTGPSSKLLLPRVKIDGSSIVGTYSNTDLQLVSNGSSNIKIADTARIDNNLSVGGANSGSTLVTYVAGVDYNTYGLLVTYSTLTASIREANWTTVAGKTALLSKLIGETFTVVMNPLAGGGPSSSIVTLTSNWTLVSPGVWEASITMSVPVVDFYAYSVTVLSIKSALEVISTSNFTNTTTGLITQTGNFNQIGTSSADITGNISAVNYTLTGLTSRLDAGNFRISGQTIAGKVTNGDVTYTADGTGNVIIQGLTTTGNTISSTATNSSITLTPNGTGNVIVSSNKAFTVPYGNSLNRTLSVVGEIRQNSTTSLYEGWSPSGLVSFNGVYDSDRNTYITPELTPGANDNTLRFAIDGTVSVTLDATKLFTNNITVGNVSISGQTISNAVSANNLEITPSGTGKVLINSIPFKDNVITNTQNSSFNLSSTGAGYIKFGGTGAVAFPSGADSDRRINPEIGELRFNTDLGKEEIFDGQTWISIGGSSTVASEEEITTETNLWAFVLG